ncbi:MAG: hypothetical protein ACQEVA_15980 [Myxococcota bacterium]
MKLSKPITILGVLVAGLAAVAASLGIFSVGGPGEFTHVSVRGEEVLIWGRGFYRHMSAQLAPQGIAQDVVTLTVGVPLLLVALFWARRGSLRGRLMLTGTLGYFMVTYVFYLVMATYNRLFLLYVVLAGAAFYAFTLAMMSFDVERVAEALEGHAPRRFVGIFLIVNALAISAMWLGIVVPPTINGTIPPEVEHYTTLIVQGLDLSILLPASLLAGILLIRRRAFGYLLATVYIVFLALLMTALVGKIVGQHITGVEVGLPPFIVIPAITLTAILGAAWMLRSVRQDDGRSE